VSAGVTGVGLISTFILLDMTGFYCASSIKSEAAVKPSWGGKPQTKRLWEDAINRAKQLGIDDKNVVGILLSPGGEPATSSAFGVLSFKEFADAVSDAITDVLGYNESISRAAASILGFMSFYGRQ